MSDGIDFGPSPQPATDWAVHSRSTDAWLQRDGSLYHYTDTKGLKGILDSGQLWGTHVAYLNDSQEFSYGVEAICAMIHQYGREVKAIGNKPTDELGANAIMDVCAKVLRAKNLLEENLGPFVTCFSVYGDELSQWRGYANGGYAIRFDRETLKNSVRQTTVPSDLPISGLPSRPALRSVEYLPEKQRKRVTELIDQHVDELIEAAQHNTHADVDSAQERLIKKIIPLAASIKHRKFVGEAEQRLVSHTSETFYSPSRIGLIPRVRFAFDPNAIIGVLVGPSEHCDVKILSLYRYLRHQYPKVEVIRSNVPYRDI
ncbi:DUF2971 domain-containing protein [Mycobacterium simiae]|uniref:DUF2971 domain-containing protein n=1 Tax=Mycobacterium simiae TaxID=1784 RepID=A0A5B1BL10_MYCSI|nr:DUF2971 domain-containing protein [Mycobacterium simiae]KAA1249367.1 DUF2971 domain-containing protein [Mycobacterium simiae]